MEGALPDRGAGSRARARKACSTRGPPPRSQQEARSARRQGLAAGARQAPEPALEALATDIYSPEPRSALRTGDRGRCRATREITCSQALFEALAEEIERDESVYLLGEDVTDRRLLRGHQGACRALRPERIVDTPISEYAIVGSAVGAAMAGRRPVGEILFSDFLTTCMDPMVNQAAKLRYMSGGQYSLPLVVRTPGGAGLGMAAQHSQSLEALLTGHPGLIVVAPGHAVDAKGLLKAAIRSNNPVVFFENKLLYAESGPVPEGDYLVPLGVADVKRRGSRRDAGHRRRRARKGARGGRSVRQPGRVRRGDRRAHAGSARSGDDRQVGRSTGRLVTVEDGPTGHGFGSEIVARVVEVAHNTLHSAPRRVGAADVPLAYNSKLENAALPDVARIAAAIEATL